MEPHTEQSGHLRDKFEGFAHTPSPQVWDRIVAEPSGRPLGAKFWAFAWAPSPRVWRRINRELHPVAWTRVAAWTGAAAAGLALLLWIGSAARSTATQGHALASHDERQLRWDGVSGSAPVADEKRALDAGKALLTDGGSVKAVRPSAPVPANDRRQPGRDAVEMAATPVAAASMPVPRELPGLKPRAAGRLAPDLQLIDRRNNLVQALAYEVRTTSLPPIEQRFGNEDAQDLRSMYAQASTNLGAGGVGGSMQYTQEYGDVTNGASVSPDNSFFAVKESPETFKTPLVIGAMMDMGIRGPWSAAAGLTYTHMASSLQAGANHYEITRQYLGVAAATNFTLPIQRVKGLAAYATGGLQLDLGLSKEVENTTPGAESRLKEKLGPQASMNLGAGMRYRIVGPLSVYGQATASNYFFGTDANLYTERIIWPSAQVGLRVGL